MIFYKLIDDQIAIRTVIDRETKTKFVCDTDRCLNIVCLMCMDLYAHAVKNAHKGMHMKIKRKIRIISMFFIVLMVFLCLEKLFPHNGSIHHPCFWCFVTLAVIDLWIFSQSHFHADLLRYDT